MTAVDLWLVRHGEAAASWGQSPDPGLSELGQQQAGHAAVALHGTVPAHCELWSSPLLRAQETAAPLAQALGSAVTLNEAFREVPSPVPLAERQDWLRGFMREDWSRLPESLQQWREAMVQAAVAVQTPTVVFTHFLVINTLVAAARGETATCVCWPDNASITRLRVQGDALELVALGEQMQTFVN